METIVLVPGDCISKDVAYLKSKYKTMYKHLITNNYPTLYSPYYTEMCNEKAGPIMK